MKRIFAQQLNEHTDCSLLELYSKFKFGDKEATHWLANILAETLWEHYQYQLLSEQIVVIPSPYNFLPNAASMLTKEVVNLLNQQLWKKTDLVLETTIIHRKVNYTLDYGFMGQKEREKLIGNDNFYVNKSFIKDKTLIFIDDIFVTGAHERRLQQLLVDEHINNNCLFAYYGEYTGTNEVFEGKLNKWCFETTNHKEFFTTAAINNNYVIVRVVKELLSMDFFDFKEILSEMYKINPNFVEQIYNGAIGERYHLIPKYQPNSKLLSDYF